VSLPETEGLILLDELFCALLGIGLAGLALELGGTLEISTSCCQLLLLFLLSAIFADYLLGYFKLLVLEVCLGMRLKQLRSLLPMTRGRQGVIVFWGFVKAGVFFLDYFVVDLVGDFELGVR
jgi:hypothetical protein